MVSRYDATHMTPAEREDLLIKMVPGDMIIVPPAQGQGCPCQGCGGEWHELLFSDGTRQRSGICSMRRELLVVRAGMIPAECPVPGIVGGEVDLERVILPPINFIPAGAPVKGGAELSRDFSNFPNITAQRKVIPVNPRRERSEPAEAI